MKFQDDEIVQSILFRGRLEIYVLIGRSELSDLSLVAFFKTESTSDNKTHSLNLIPLT